jgi:hypothetical protein
MHFYLHWKRVLGFSAPLYPIPAGESSTFAKEGGRSPGVNSQGAAAAKFFIDKSAAIEAVIPHLFHSLTSFPVLPARSLKVSG